MSQCSFMITEEVQAMPQIKIRIEKGVETAGDGQEQQEKKEKDSLPTASPTAMLFYHQAISTGKQIIGYAASNVANFTGNYLMQDQINNALDIVGDFTTIGLGATRGIPGLIVSVLGVGTKRAFQAISMYQEDVHAQNEQRYLLKRSGNATTNGSRGTEN